MVQRDPRHPPSFGYDLENILSPISAEKPAGEHLLYEPLYDALKELRREDDASLPQGVWKRELKKADWPGAASLAIETLETQSKDLQIAIWLLEAWLHLHGFAGVEEGLKLLRGLAEDFWPDVHPPIDEEGDLDYRLAPLRWLDSHLPTELKGIPVTQPDSDDASPVTWLDWQRATRLAQAERAAQKEAEASGQITQAKFMVSVSMTPTSFFLQLDEHLESLTTAAGDLVECLDEKAGKEAPSLGKAKSCLEEIRHFLRRVTRERQGEESDVEGSDPMTPEFPAGTGEGGLDEDEQDQPTGGRIRTRAEAYRRLNEAADFLLRTEPHSPAPYLVKRAVTWGNLTLAELLQELLAKNADLSTIYTLLGIKSSD